MKIKKWCRICKKEFLVDKCRKTTAVVCSPHCRAIYVYRKYGLEKILTKSRKGLIPWNTGRYVRVSKHTEFKAGHRPWNKGVYCRNSPKSEFKEEPRLDLREKLFTVHERNNKGWQYKIVKLKNPKWIRRGNRWKRLEHGYWETEARVKWEKHRGSIPEKHVIYHTDGNSLNNKLSNLECISRAQLLWRNQCGRIL
jgi:hypothetical protein